MRDPFRSELEAFHFVLLTVLAFAAIVAATVLGGVWFGVGVWVGVSAAAAAVYLRHGRTLEVDRTPPEHVGPADERRVLVVAHGRLAGTPIIEAIEHASAGGHTELFVVCPPLVSPAQYFASDLDAARDQAVRRLEASLTGLHAAGLEAHGNIGDEDSVRAIEDALGEFPADEIIIATRPKEAATWFERGVVTRARARFALPITQVMLGAGERPA